MKKSFLAVVFVCTMVFTGSVSLFAETVTHTIDFENLTGQIGSNWSWNNTTDRLHSGMMPEDFLDVTSSGWVELYPGWDLPEYGYNQTVGKFHVQEKDGISSATFSHLYQDWGTMLSWEGIGVSTVTDTTYSSYMNEMASLSGSGANGSPTYAVVYSNGDIEIPTGTAFASMMINNTVYAFESMAAGDGFAPQLASIVGGYLDLIITGFDSEGNETGSMIRSLGRNTDGVVDMITDWTFIDLSGEDFENATKLTFGFDSNVEDQYGDLYPLYFAMDDLVYRTWDTGSTEEPEGPGPSSTPEPTTALVFLLGMSGAGLVLRRRRMME